MRNGHSALSIGGMVALAALLLVGCAPYPRAAKRASKPVQQAVLDAGFAALENQQYNEAVSKADEFLASTPHGPGSAEALYLKGRALEGKNASGSLKPEEITHNLHEARAAYISALEQIPRQPLDAYIRTSLANVAYFQDDYRTAISQWTASYDKLDHDDLKAWALYRIGVSQQRLGQFAQSDQTFASVQQFHPGSVPAVRAKEHQGARSFYVQLATFASPQSADAAIAELKRQGINAQRVNDAEGKSLLRLGPVASYGQALYFKNRLAEKYPDAIVLP